MPQEADERASRHSPRSMGAPRRNQIKKNVVPKRHASFACTTVAAELFIALPSNPPADGHALQESA
jgi:hypothetical protein